MRKKETQEHRLSVRADWRKYKWLYWMVIPVVLYYGIFMYIPMLGQVIAFQDYRPARGILGSDWVGLENFIDFFSSPFAWRVIRNTIIISFNEILFGFPAPIILALLLNEMGCRGYKKALQTVSYIPHFVSLVVMCGIIVDFTSSRGVITHIMEIFGGENQNLLANSSYFVPIYVVSGIWKNIGWGSIIYLSTLSGVDENLYEAAAIDGAGRWQRLLHVTLPALVPIIAIQLIMRVGNIMSAGAEKIILLYSPAVYETADTIASYVYRSGIQEQSYSLAAAVGMFNSVINLGLVVFANWFSRRFVDESLW